MRELSVPVFDPGEVVATNVSGKLMFYVVGTDGAFVHTDAAELEPDSRPLAPEGLTLTRDTPVGDLLLSVRAYNVCKREGLHTVGQVIDYYYVNNGDFGGLRNLGPKGSAELNALVDSCKEIF